MFKPQPNRDASLTDLWFAAGLFALGLLVLLRNHWAEVHHSVITAKHGAIVDSWQSYLGVVLCFGLTAYIVFKVLFRKRDG
jgi:hypothetical protein